MNKRRTGRRPGDPEDTRRAILVSARRCFGASGFDRATIRAIASDAEVDPALVMHHFGDKRGLFVAAHQLPANPADVFGPLPVEQRGFAVARAYLQIFATPDSTALSLLRAATTEPAAAVMLREFFEGVIIPLGLPILHEPGDDGELRLTLLASHLLGVAVARSVVELGPVAQPTLDELAAVIAPVIQVYIDGAGRPGSSHD
jgi:AcrR family transcriptional regulator